MKYTELDEAGKARVREKNRRRYEPEYGWWEDTVEDMCGTVALLGITVARNDQKNDKSYKVYFSGFWSQGDGACFVGRYAYKDDAVEKVKADRPTDETINDIAQELAVFHITCRLNGRACERTVGIETTGSHRHSGTMRLQGVPYFGYDDDDITEEEQDALLQIMRSVADWMYRELEEEYEYLTSDEYLDELLADEDVDEFYEIV